MSRDDDFHVRLGRVLNQGRRVNKPFVGRVLASAHKAGGLHAGRSRWYSINVRSWPAGSFPC